MADSHQNNLYPQGKTETELKPGVERHIWPFGNEKAVVTKSTSDRLFGAEGLGFKNNLWMKLVSYLARTGIQEQTASKKNETDIANSVKGWGQGANSSRVFNVTKGVDPARMELLIQRLLDISKEFEIENNRLTHDVLAAFVTTQKAEPYLTWNGLREAKGFIKRNQARFRGHIQWQSFVALCGHVDQSGIKHITPELLRTFFTSPRPFFNLIVERRAQLLQGVITPGSKTGLMADAPEYVNIKATDLEYMRNKGGLGLVLKILWYMVMNRKSKLGPLPKEEKISPI